MVYNDDVCVLFGGLESGFGGDISDETWLWDTTDWTLATPGTNAPATWMHGMAYDATNLVVVMFGGAVAGNVLTDETWTYDGSDWVEVIPATTTPDARSFPNMAYDETNGNVVMYGGNTAGDTPNQETWVWDGTDWTEMSPTNVPYDGGTTASFYLPMWWDPLTATVMLVSQDDVLWSWDGSDWTNVGTAPATFLMSGAHSANLNLGILVSASGTATPGTFVWDGTTLEDVDPLNDGPWGDLDVGLPFCPDGNGDVVEFSGAWADEGDGGRLTKVYKQFEFAATLGIVSFSGVSIYG